jgi:uncharacterized protein YcaQ
MSFAAISQTEARQMHLAAQGLSARPPHAATKGTVLEAIRRMQLVQIDTINVVARSQYLVLWSRIGSYTAEWLDELLAEGKVFEYWAHAACYIPIERFPLFEWAMRNEHVNWRGWGVEHADVIDKVRTSVVNAGEMRSVDFKRVDGGAGQWWSWKPEKMALEYLVTTGELMISRRDGFQRVYAPRDHVLRGRFSPLDARDQAPHSDFVALGVRALGVARGSWISDYYRLKRTGLTQTVRDLLEQGILHEVRVDGWDKPAVVHQDNLQMLSAEPSSVTTFLSPFDPVIWHRVRARELFGFDYTLEIYVPQAKRKYGYFTMAILHRGALIGLIDPKAHRQERRLELRAMHLNADVEMTDRLVEDLAQAISDFSSWHGASEVTIGNVYPKKLGAVIRRQLRLLT